MLSPIELHIPKRKVHFENVRSVTRFLTKMNFESLRERIDFNSWTQHQVRRISALNCDHRRIYHCDKQLFVQMFIFHTFDIF